MTEREYRRLRARIDERHREDLAALERVWRMAQGSDHPQMGARITVAKGAVQTAVREAIQTLNGRFTLRDVEVWLRTNKPGLSETSRTTISGTLKRLVGLDIEIEETGRGKRASSYRRITSKLAAVGGTEN